MRVDVDDLDPGKGIGDRGNLIHDDLRLSLLSGG
jgi:hypothetical protein